MERSKQKPIDKEYLLSSFKDFDSDVLSKKYLHSDNELLHSHDNKEILDKLNVSDTGELLFNGSEVGSPASATAGKSAYEIAQDNGFEGTESEWLESLKGKDGTNGTDGMDGADGANGNDGMDGRSAYEIAVQNGFTGTEQEWLDSLRGEAGASIDAYTKKESDERFITATQIWTGSNQFKFGVDADGNYGYYKAGADTVTPFKAVGGDTIYISQHRTRLTGVSGNFYTGVKVTNNNSSTVKLSVEFIGNVFSYYASVGNVPLHYAQIESNYTNSVFVGRISKINAYPTSGTALGVFAPLFTTVSTYIPLGAIYPVLKAGESFYWKLVNVDGGSNMGFGNGSALYLYVKSYSTNSTISENLEYTDLIGSAV